MTDRRELILVRQHKVLRDIVAPQLSVPVEKVFRNRGVIPAAECPAMALLDGVERGSVPIVRTSTRQGPAGSQDIRVQWRPGLMDLRSQIWSLLKPRPLEKAFEIGPLLSLHRNVILEAFTTDEELFTLISTNGRIEYLGCDTDMQTGSSMEGQLSVNFAFHYLLDPSEL